MCSLVFPAAANGDHTSWRLAHGQLHGNIWRLIGCHLLAVGPITVAVLLIASFLASTQVGDSGASGMLLAELLAIPASLFSMFLLIALLASTLCGFCQRLVLAPRERPAPAG